MILSVITSYYDRPAALRVFKEFVKSVDNENVEFIIEEWKSETIFSTAWCHNMAVVKANGKWILKQDIDCICDPGLYDKIIELVSDKDDRFFANFGCKNYLSDIGFPQGNQYLCSKDAYIHVDGEPEFTGYGMEDYCMLYKLAKYNDPEFMLDYNERNIDSVIRDHLTRPLNRVYKDYFFMHREHPRCKKEIRSKWLTNKRELYKICRELDK